MRRDGEAISLEEIKNASVALLTRMQMAGLSEVKVAGDQAHYWKVFPSEIFSPSEPSPVKGGVSDDLGDLRKEMEQRDSAYSLGSFWHALNHLSGILSVLAAKDLAGDFDETLDQMDSDVFEVSPSTGTDRGVS
ncbi:hypothetical protein HDIA_3827 [Hartmannibacter diazotrophicus]|uniref:Uncharacterized protein n=2 Tax=Hartmannibacter diazotrophicus TaxID=1482074 RepID=A0A2C9DB59_9HYPH|nr:hypothetical protein HDIA_3827 [Hartmannibacter diazotrophicus]